MIYRYELAEKPSALCSFCGEVPRVHLYIYEQEQPPIPSAAVCKDCIAFVVEASLGDLIVRESDDDEARASVPLFNAEVHALAAIVGRLEASIPPDVRAHEFYLAGLIVELGRSANASGVDRETLLGVIQQCLGATPASELD